MPEQAHNPWDLEPRTNRFQSEVERKLRHLHDPRVAPLTKFVEALSLKRGELRSVPWFDPNDAGVEAKILLLFEAPGPRAVGPGGLDRPQLDPGSSPPTIMTAP